MGKVTGFLEIRRQMTAYRPVEERIGDFRQVSLDAPVELVRKQGARCMDCGIPFCHPGCPLGNIIPDWNDLAYRDRWKDALTALHATNNFPEFTGWVCPAPCEAACVLGINDDPVTIKQIELAIIDRGFKEGVVKPLIPEGRTGMKVAVIGSGPAGLACAQQLCRSGHSVTVFERDERIGGLLTYGIPDFKLEKSVVERRLEQMSAEGVEFRTETHVGVTLPASEIVEEYDGVVLCGGATQPRDLEIPGRELHGVCFAMEYLAQQNRRVYGHKTIVGPVISAEGKRVVVLGGGDTGSDCVGTAIRQGAASIVQVELLPKPPADRSPDTPWPLWPNILRTSSSHEEGAKSGKLTRDWSVLTKALVGSGGQVRGLKAVRLEWTATGGNGKYQMKEIPGTEFEIDADLVILALGFLGPQREGMLQELGLELDIRGNVACNNEYMSSVPGVFAAGDMRRGQSLVVWAIHEGRQAAGAVDRYLMETGKRR
jgi:glutamate synthase (NADPH/NADH) small chain